MKIKNLILSGILSLFPLFFMIALIPNNKIKFNINLYIDEYSSIENFYPGDICIKQLLISHDYTREVSYIINIINHDCLAFELYQNDKLLHRFDENSIFIVPKSLHKYENHLFTLKIIFNKTIGNEYQNQILNYLLSVKVIN